MLDSPLEHIYAHALAFAAGALSVVLVLLRMQHASEGSTCQAISGASASV